MPTWSTVIETPNACLLALLFVGHICADFLAQSSEVAEKKKMDTRSLWQHALLALLTHGILLIPFWGWFVLLGIIVLALAHLAIDSIKIRLDARRPGSLALFFLDQAAHAAVILTLWYGLVSVDAQRQSIIAFDQTWTPVLARGLVVFAGLIFNGTGGTAIVRRLLERFPDVVPSTEPGTTDSESRGYAMGRMIGCLERYLIFAMVLLGQWGALGLVLAAKSIARFKEFGTQHFADYYLIGTLASMLVAIASAFLVRALVFT